MATLSFPSSNSTNSPCAACKCLRRKCMPGCIFAPYFPPDEPHKFFNVHRIFGASNVAKLLIELRPQHRLDAVNSMAYEAEARVRDPVYGCVATISVLQSQVERLQKELDAARAHLFLYACRPIIPKALPIAPSMTVQPAIAMAYNRDESAGAQLLSSHRVQECRRPATGSMTTGEKNSSGNYIDMDQIRDGR